MDLEVVLGVGVEGAYLHAGLVPHDTLYDPLSVRFALVVCVEYNISVYFTIRPKNSKTIISRFLKYMFKFSNFKSFKY
jgi:hypothetical protein